MVGRTADKRVERAFGLRVGRGRLVIDDARRQLDTIPRHEVRGHELGERFQRATSQFRLCPGSHDRSRDPVRSAHVSVGEPGHDGTITIHPLRRRAVTNRRASRRRGNRFAMVGRVEPGALVARGERLQNALDSLPGRRAADQALSLIRCSSSKVEPSAGGRRTPASSPRILLPVGERSARMRDAAGPAVDPVRPGVRCLDASASRRIAAPRPELLAAGPVTNRLLLSVPRREPRGHERGLVSLPRPSP